MELSVSRVERAVVRPPQRVAVPGGGRRAAVAVVVTPELELILLRRAEHPADPWSGHVSFPGGRVEPGETPLQAALRETSEEIGLDLRPARQLGSLDELTTAGHLPPLVIHPFVFAVGPLPELRPNYEVATIHRLGLSTLLRGDGRGAMKHTWRDQPVTLPRVDFAGGRLWGLTLHMVDDLLHRLDDGGRGLQRLGGGERTPWQVGTVSS